MHHERKIPLLDRLLKDGQAVPLREEPLAVAKDVAFEEVVATDEFEDAAEESDLRVVGAVRAVAEEVDLRCWGLANERAGRGEGTNPAAAHVVVQVEKGDSRLEDASRVARDVEFCVVVTSSAPRIERPREKGTHGASLAPLSSPCSLSLPLRSPRTE